MLLTKPSQDGSQLGPVTERSSKPSLNLVGLLFRHDVSRLAVEDA